MDDETEKYISLSNHLSKMSSNSKEILDLLDESIDKIYDLPNFEETEDFIVEAKNTNEVIIFYKEFIAFKNVASKLRKSLNMKSVLLNNYLIEEKISVYCQLREECEKIKKYENINIVKKNIRDIDNIFSKFIDVISEYHFKDLEESEIDFCDDKVKVSSFLQEEISEKNFVEKYVTALQLKILRPIKILENDAVSIESLKAFNKKNCKFLLNFLECFDKNFKNLEINTKTLLKPSISSIVYVQIKENVIVFFNKYSFRTLKSAENNNIIESFPYILKIFNLVTMLDLKNFRRNEVYNFINNLLVELKKQLLDLKIKTLTKINEKLEVLYDVFDILSDDAHLDYIKQSANTLKIRNFDDLKKIFEPVLKNSILRLKNTTIRAVIYKINNLTILKMYYDSIYDCNLDDNIAQLENKIVSLYVEDLESKNLQSEAEILRYAETLDEKWNCWIENPSKKERIIGKIVEKTSKEFNISESRLEFFSNFFEKKI